MILDQKDSENQSDISNQNCNSKGLGNPYTPRETIICIKVVSVTLKGFTP